VTITLSDTVNRIKNFDDFLILTHLRPDGDTLGCAGGLAQGLREFGKTAYVLYNPEVTPRYELLVENYYAPENYVPQCIIIVDTATLDMLPKNALEYANQIVIGIDHHASNTLYAKYTYLDAECASCGELVYDILMELSGSISPVTAGHLYAALATDTGCFSYANTTANVLETAARVIEAGAAHREMNKAFFRTKSRNRVKIEGAIFSGMEFWFDGTVAVSAITRDMIEHTGVVEDDLDDIASLPGSVDGVVVGITIRELTSERDCKISVRTSPSVNSSEICAFFGGGGHPMAAGATVNATIGEIKEKLKSVLGEMTFAL
jgi:phosphoesterase RecJ-like protein